MQNSSVPLGKGAGDGGRYGLDVSALPFVDEHAAVVEAAPGEVWAALVGTIDGAFGGRAATGYARLVGCEPRRAGGPRPLTAGSTLPGFEVVGARPGAVLELVGRHRFARYALTFRLDDLGDGTTRLRAETRSEFPGLAGAVYRAAVIGSGVHGVSVRRLLAGVARRSASAG
jgi:hypothetical protein